MYVWEKQALEKIKLEIGLRRTNWGREAPGESLHLLEIH
jgi:hypothetical protein